MEKGRLESGVRECTPNTFILFNQILFLYIFIINSPVAIHINSFFFVILYIRQDLLLLNVKYRLLYVPVVCSNCCMFEI